MKNIGFFFTITVAFFLSFLSVAQTTNFTPIVPQEFSPKTNIVAPVSNNEIISSDLNEDGITDFTYSGFINLSKSDSSYKTIVLPGMNFYIHKSVSIVRDIDNNGEKDILISGFDAITDSAILYVLMQENTEFLAVELYRGSIAGIAMKEVDFDEDGDLDVFLCGYETWHATGSLHSSFLINQGNLTFVEAHVDSILPVDGEYVFFDENNDGHPDILLSGQSSQGRITELYRKNGNNYDTVLHNGGNHSKSRIRIADLDGDHIDEIVIRGTGLNSISILKKQADGSYQDFASQTMKNTPFGQDGDLFLEDINNDGLKDIVSGATFSGNGTFLRVYQNLGGLSFFPVVQPSGVAFPSFPRSTMIDLNGDGFKDLVVINGINHSERKLVSNFLNNGSGRFTNAEFSPFEPGHFSTVEAVDIDNNEIHEFFFQKDNKFTVVNDSTYFYELKNDTWEINTFGVEQLIKGEGSLFGDFDGDGDEDLILVGENSMTKKRYYCTNTGSDFVTQYELDATFNSEIFKSFDFNNDQKLDFSAGGRMDSLSSSSDPYMFYNMGQGQFSFGNGRVSYVDGVSFGDYAWGDFNKDGKVDIVATGYNNNDGVSNAGLFLDENPIGFGAISIPEFVPLHDAQIEVHDFNRDGWLDFYVSGRIAGQDEWLSQLFYNDRQGGFQQELMPFSGWEQTKIHFFDFDENGILDYVISGLAPNLEIKNEVYVGNGDGTFTKVFDFPMPILADHICSGDVTGDGQSDVLIVGKGYANEGLSRLYENKSTSYLNIESRSKEELNLIVYPNPSNGLFILEIPENTTIDALTIYDIFGKEVKFELNKLSSSRFEIRLQTKGFYQAKVNSKKGNSSFKLVVR